MDIESIARPIFSIVENGGVFALLLGSGISRTAGIPTGWNITLDLVRRLAALNGETEVGDLADWYLKKYGEDADYSKMLHKIASAPSDRRAILDAYIEPNEDERLEGLKQPTPAHRAIAQLISEGFIRVIITTNFDRLLENALRDEGVEPTVIASRDALMGAEPLAHSKCVIFKLHGDYKDTRILNTEAELSAYPPAYNKMLGQIFDEYGLIVSGWSGDWDHALRGALLRAKSRRYPTYWISKGEPTEKASALISHRKAEVISVVGADEFFTSLRAGVVAAAETRRVSPRTVETILAAAKRAIGKAAPHIEFDDLFSEELRRVEDQVLGDRFGAYDAANEDNFRKRVSAIESASEVIAKLCFLIGRYGIPSDLSLVHDAIRRVHAATNSKGNGMVLWLHLPELTIVFMMACTGMGLIAAGRWSELRALLDCRISRSDRQAKAAVDMFHLWDWEIGGKDTWNILFEPKSRKTPLSDFLCNTTAKWISEIGGVVSDPLVLFTQYELLAALAQLQRVKEVELAAELARPNGKVRMSAGQFGWNGKLRRRALDGITEPVRLQDLVVSGFGPRSFFDLYLKNVERVTEGMNY